MNAETHRKLLVVQVAGLSHTFDEWAGPELRPIQSIFPAVTCTVQASFRTASPPREHGMVANGLFHRDLGRVMFWEQSARLVAGERIWKGFRERGGRVAMLFWQQSMGEDVDIALSPAPIHKHHGGMIQDCYSRPERLYKTLCERVGRPFKLRHYWGPPASPKSGEWIAAATAALLADAELAPDLCLTYLPTLDYDLQRFGPDHAKAAGAAGAAKRQLLRLLDAAASQGYEVLIFGDYAIAPVSAAAFPNRALLKAGLMSVRKIRGMLYPDLHTSRAFAMVDHEIAHVYVRDPADIEGVRELLSATDGVKSVLDRAAQSQVGLDHPNSGELVLQAREGRWFAYPWWTGKRQAPDYARHVDIHNKPGFDPCELFRGWPPGSISQDTWRMRGSHGRIGPGREVLWGATFDLPTQPANLIELASAVRDWLLFSEWPSKDERQEWEIKEFIAAYRRLPHGRMLVVDAKRDKPDYFLKDPVSGHIYGVELTSDYLDDRSVPDVHMKPLKGPEPIPYTRASLEKYKKRLANRVGKKSCLAKRGYDLRYPLILSVYVNEYITIYMNKKVWEGFVEEYEHVFKNVAPFTEVVFWPLPTSGPNGGVFSVRPNPELNWVFIP